MTQEQQEEIHYFELTQFDFNDVFDKKIYKATYDQIEQFVKQELRDFGYTDSDMEEIGGDPESIVCYYPVTDDNGNLVPETDSNYDELSEQQESRVELGYTMDKLDDPDQSEIDEAIDLTEKSN